MACLEITSLLIFFNLEEVFEPRVYNLVSTLHQLKGSLFSHRMWSGMIHKKSVFCRLDGVFVLEGGKLDVLLDGTGHALYQSITLRMVQCSSGVFDSTLGEIILYLVGGKLNTVVHHNMYRVTLTHKYTLKKLYDTTSCNIGHKFNLAPFRKVVDENDSVFPIHGLEGTHDVHGTFCHGPSGGGVGVIGAWYVL